MAEKWQKTSGPPPSCSMKPKPFSALNHFTVPWVISFSFRAEGVPGGGPPVRDRRTDRRNREERQAGTTADVQEREQKQQRSRPLYGVRGLRGVNRPHHRGRTTCRSRARTGCARPGRRPRG